MGTLKNKTISLFHSFRKKSGFVQGMAIGLSLTSVVTFAVTVPYSFTANTVISAADINANFATLEAALNSLQVGTTPGKIVQLNAAGQLPAIDGSLLTNVNATFAGVLPVVQGGTGTTSLGSNAIMKSNSVGSALEPLICSTGQIIVFSGGSPSCSNITSFAQNGNAYGVTAKVGTSDSQDFRLISSGLERLSITANGDVGVGTTAPQAAFHIASTTKGFLPPVMTTAQRDTIAAPSTGTQIFNGTVNEMEYYSGTDWKPIGGKRIGLTSIWDGSTATPCTNTNTTYPTGYTIAPITADYHSGHYNSSTKIFTVPEDGVYLVSVDAPSSLPNKLKFYFLTNFGHIESMNSDNYNQYKRFTAGDTIKFFYSCYDLSGPSTVTLEGARFQYSIMKI